MAKREYVNEYPVKIDDHAIAERVREVYDLIVDQTENPRVTGNFTLNKILSWSLELLEYVQGNDGNVDDLVINQFGEF